MTNPYGPPSGPQPQPPYGQQPAPGTPQPGVPVQQYPGYGAPMPGQPGYPGGQPVPGYGGFGLPKTNGLAVASMVVSLVSILSFYGAILVGLVGLILGHVARRQINQQPNLYQGRGMALTGIIIGWITFGFWLLFVIFAIVAVTWAGTTGQLY